ncbi:hypothetical protein [Rahnella perminowiae]|uniref:hypothetical protein n=1 Tax=Rahnella perminowiae TaxID=2816244 RepID=UPI001EE5AEB6|nr:hypothetical protein [Rahnella perminowiae]
MSSEAFSQMVDTYLSNNTQLDRNERGAITQWAAALSGSAVGGVIGGTTGAQSGAAVSLDAERYNRQLHPDEVARIKQLSGGDKEKEARLKAAACALVKCSAEFTVGSADYVKAQALEQLGNSDAYATDRAQLASQSGSQLVYAMGSYANANLPMFGYSISDQTGDALSRYGVGTRIGGLVQTTEGEFQALGGMAMCTTGVACLAGSYLAASGIDTAYAGANSFLSGISHKTSGAYLLEGLGVSPAYSEAIYGFSQMGAAGFGVWNGLRGEAIAATGSVPGTNDILSTPLGQRPDPAAYMTPEYISQDLALFDEGATKFMTETNFNKYGIGQIDGTSFVLAKTEVDMLMKNANGDPARLEQSLGLPSGFFSTGNVVRVDIPSPGDFNLRMPSGNEAGANGFWIPGGKLPNNNAEAIIDAGSILPSNYTISPVKFK